jgi:hypothetical protein
VAWRIFSTNPQIYGGRIKIHFIFAIRRAPDNTRQKYFCFVHVFSDFITGKSSSDFRVKKKKKMNESNYLLAINGIRHDKSLAENSAHTDERDEWKSLEFVKIKKLNESIGLGWFKF